MDGSRVRLRREYVLTAKTRFHRPPVEGTDAIGTGIRVALHVVDRIGYSQK